MISAPIQGKTFNVTVIQAYALTTNAEEAEFEQFYDDIPGATPPSSEEGWP